MQNLRERPTEDEQAEAAPGAETVGEIPGARVHDRVGEEEEGEDVRILLLAEMELVADVDRHDAERLLVEIIQNRGNAEKRRDDPSQAGNFHVGASISEGVKGLLSGLIPKYPRRNNCRLSYTSALISDPSVLTARQIRYGPLYSLLGPCKRHLHFYAKTTLLQSALAIGPPLSSEK